ncbi:ribose-phosphate pyrophosphokinase 4-like [Camellia sinensis]|uniref:ribose-phosphate diphosphokinase n=2 Tax=Camellia sinensis TaxID=4442 RepID=A0A4S4CZ99_CAMSN|nr:ribose-phosphate pyrophosphokinase 4-like [Camellia sinensis]THF95230.1 hypothetical protein TEA_024916 [Camellia sinensis var. sinensis]
MPAAPPPPPPPPPLPSPARNPGKILKLSSSSSPLLSKPPHLRSFVKDRRIRCDLSSFDGPQKWTVDCVSGSDPIHIILKPPPSSSIPMASIDSTVKSAKKVCLFYCAEMEALAERVAAESDAIELRSITWRTFQDGFPNLFISNAHGIRGQHVAFLASFSSPGVIFEQLSVIYALPKLFVSSFTLVLPFFPTGTSERMEEEGDVATAFTLARILSNIPISRGGPTSLVIFDIHALQERFYFGDNVLPCFESGIPLLKNRLQQLPDSNNISIAFPDDGAWKRFHNQLQHFPTIVCAKVREGDQRIVRLKEGDPRGRHVVIVDDLVQSGGTLIECQKMLAKHGATKISAYVTHGIFPNRSWERFEYDNGGCPENGLTYFWITDSCPRTVQAVKSRPPFEVLSLSASISATLQI